MAKTRILIFGASGRMGGEVLALAERSTEFSVAARVGKAAGKKPEGLMPLEKVSPKKIDVVIDFSLPEGFSEILNWCEKNEIPLVSGTTGLESQQIQSLKRASRKIPVLWSANMSLGVAALSRALEGLPVLGGFDITIEEFHHKKKKDRPSGTALALKKSVEAVGGNNVEDIVSVRGGGIFGIHRVHFMAQEETLTFEHVALNRTVFARGALKAAKWLEGKKPGLFTIKDVL